MTIQKLEAAIARTNERLTKLYAIVDVWEPDDPGYVEAENRINRETLVLNILKTEKAELERNN